jgi:hypothetical protein
MNQTPCSTMHSGSRRPTRLWWLKGKPERLCNREGDRASAFSYVYASGFLPPGPDRL